MSFEWWGWKGKFGVSSQGPCGQNHPGSTASIWKIRCEEHGSSPAAHVNPALTPGYQPFIGKMVGRVGLHQQPVTTTLPTFYREKLPATRTWPRSCLATPLGSVSKRLRSFSMSSASSDPRGSTCEAKAEGPPLGGAQCLEWRAGPWVDGWALPSTAPRPGSVKNLTLAGWEIDHWEVDVYFLSYKSWMFHGPWPGFSWSS